MKLKEIKTAREVRLPGVRVEYVTEGTTLKEVILRPEGEEVSYSVRPGPSYSECVKVFERRTFETQERFRLSGTVLGVQVQEDFDTKREAEDTEGRLTAQAGPDSVELKITSVTVQLDDDGELLPNPEDIPF